MAVLKSSEIDKNLTIDNYQTLKINLVAGLLEYQTVADSVAALCCLNHFVLKSAKNNPFTLKLCFANNQN